MPSQEILVNVTTREIRIALLEQGNLHEVYVERRVKQGIIGNIYKGKVSRLLPGIQAAFVDIGLERSAFLHIGDMVSDSTKDIRDIIHVGQEILVQVYKDPLGSKGARLTTQFTIPAHYLVFTPNVFQISISQKITNELERARLFSLIAPNEEGGYILRTAAEGVSQANIAKDQSFLVKWWKEIKSRFNTAKAGTIIYEEIPLPLRVLRDLAGDVQRIRIDDEKTFEKMVEFAQCYVPHLESVIEYYADKRPIFDIYSVEDEIQKALQRKVYLKSGGYLVFDQTEAMTTIDVNSGSFNGQGLKITNLEQTTFKINIEAVETIVRQIKLRNLGGIIIVDFIDMTEQSHKQQLMQSLTNALSKETVQVEVSELSRLGLVQMTRKRTRESLEQILCVTCPLCHHRGTIKSFSTVVYDIFRELKRVAQIFPWNGFLVIAAQGVIDYLQEEESTGLAELESQLRKPIKLRVENSYTQEQYDILPLSEKE